MKTLETINLSRNFGPSRAVEDLTLSVSPGELFGLIGPDGAGKTTTLRMLAGILAPSSGTARVLGKDIVQEAEKIKEEIGYMSQKFGLYADLTVLENMNFYADIFAVSKAERRARIDELLDFSNLRPFGQRRAGNLSGGMKQKLGLACALIHTPRLLLLDEPTNGVDPVSRREFWRILNRLLKEGVTILVATAYLDEADRCNRVGLIHRGRLLACDSPDNLKKMASGKALEIVTDNPRQTLHLLRARADLSVSLFGDRLHAIVGGLSAEQEISVILGTAGLSFSLREIEPSLEDIFIQTMSRNGGDVNGFR